MRTLAGRISRAIARLLRGGGPSGIDRAPATPASTTVPVAVATAPGIVVTDGGRGNQVCGAEGDVSDVSVSFAGSDNAVVFERGCRVRGCTVVINGNGNRISVGAAVLNNVVITCQAGDGNRLEIAAGCLLNGLSVVFAHDGNSVTVGEGTTVNGATELAAFEGRSITVGRDCLFGGDIRAWTSDSHSIVDTTGRRVNPARDVRIGDHVWVCSGATLLKGASVPSRCVVGMYALVTGDFEKPLCVIAGNPARVVRTGVDWRHELLPVDDGAVTD